MTDIFEALTKELAADTDDSGVPKSVWFWEEALSRANTLYSDAGVGYHKHLELSKEHERNLDGSIELSGQIKRFQIIDREDANPETLVGTKTDRDMSVLSVGMQVMSNKGVHGVHALSAVTRGGQRWARIGQEDQHMLINLDDPDSIPDDVYPLVGALNYITRMQQTHMGADRPYPGFTVVDMVTSMVVSQASELASQLTFSALKEEAENSDGDLPMWKVNALRAVRAQLFLRAGLVKVLLNMASLAEDEEYPTDALVRLDSHSDNLGEGHGPQFSSRLLSPGATMVLAEAVDVLYSKDWSTITADDLHMISGMELDEARWWGVQGIAMLAHQSTGGVYQTWDQLSDVCGQFTDQVIDDADNLGLTTP